MDRHQLESFLIISEQKGFSRAATRLNVSQPGLSYQISMLERDLGVSLFYTAPAGVVVTKAGSVFFHHVQRIIDSIRLAERCLNNFEDETTGNIRIGTINSLCINFLPKVLLSFKNKYSGVQPDISCLSSSEALESILQRKLDIALVADPEPDTRLLIMPLFEDKLQLVCGPAHPLFDRETVTTDELQNSQYICLATDGAAGQHISEYLEDIHLELDSILFTDNFELTKRMVLERNVLGFLPEIVTRDYSASKSKHNRQFHYIETHAPIVRNISMVSLKNRETDSVLKYFAQQVHNHAAKWSDISRNRPDKKERFHVFVST